MEEWEWWLRFNRLNIAPRRQLRLLEHFGSPRAVFQASVAALAQVEGFDRSIGPKMEAVRALDVRPDWEQLERLQATLVTYYDENYPPLLRQIADPPPLLYLLGQLCPEDQRAVAIVGSRRSSPYGRLVAENLSKGLVSYGATIVSGLARGIDAAAHQGALRAGGRTIAVLGCGLDVIYPRENRALREEISERGAVLTEFPLGTRPEAWRFPARNRLISGLSRAVVIVEAPLNSGALITADYALEQGREVFAVPGNVTNSRNAGCHRLLKDGAGLVESARDVAEGMGWKPLPETALPAAPSPPAPDLTPAEQHIYQLLGPQPKAVDDLIQEAQRPAAEVNSTLLMLELKRLVRRLPGNLFLREV